MEVQDGFILGIYNYCDRWCECCRFTSRCRLFADSAMYEAKAAGDLPPTLPKRYADVVRRAKDYSDSSYRWTESVRWNHLNDPGDPLAIVRHFAVLIATNSHRAMRGLNEDDGDRECPPDFEGSAKVVVDAIERSISAWKNLANLGDGLLRIAAAFISELQWLLGEIDELIPKARAFVRAGFDEPDEVRRLEATDWS